MKLKQSIVLLLLFAGTHFVNAQTEKFKQAIKAGLTQLNSAKSSADFVQTSNYFERIATAEPKEWYPAYYSAYSSLVAGLTTDDKGQKDQYFDRALKFADAAALISVDNSEIYVLKGYIQFMKMSIDPQARLDFMSKSAASLETAKKLNPDNPRIYLVRGQDTFYTPEAFGGGKSAAKPFLETAVARYATFKPLNDLEPNWGAGQAAALLEKCN